MPQRHRRSSQDRPVDLRPTFHCCPSCERPYSVSCNVSQDSGPRSRLPLLLPCGHDLCEVCIRACLAGQGRFKPSRHGFVICPFCRDETAFEDGVKSIHYLNCDCYVTGHIAMQQDNKARRRSSPSDETTVKKWYGPGGLSLQISERENVFNRLARFSDVKLSDPPSSESHSASHRHPCIECEGESTACCEVCDATYCDPCFDEIHEPFNMANSKHKRLPLELRGLSSIFCAEHPGTNVELYCCDDNLPVCVMCIANLGASQSKHFDHNVVPIQTQLPKMREEVAAMEKDLEIHTRSLSDALSQTSSTLKDLRESSLTVMENIHKNFVQLHRCLQKREEELLSEAHDMVQRQADPVLDARLVLDKKIKDAVRAREWCNRAARTDDEAVLRKAFVFSKQQIGDRKTAQAVFSEDTTYPFRFSIDEDFHHVLSSAADLSGGTTPRVSVVAVALDDAVDPSTGQKYVSSHFSSSSGCSSNTGSATKEETTVVGAADIAVNNHSDSQGRTEEMAAEMQRSALDDLEGLDRDNSSEKNGNVEDECIESALSPLPDLSPSVEESMQSVGAVTPPLALSAAAARAHHYALPTDPVQDKRGISSQPAAQDDSMPPLLTLQQPAAVKTEATGASASESLHDALRCHLANMQNPAQQSRGVDLLHSTKTKVEVSMPSSFHNNWTPRTAPAPSQPPPEPATKAETSQGSSRATSIPASVRKLVDGEVIVTYVGDPSTFAVQYVEDRKRIDEMNLAISRQVGRSDLPISNAEGDKVCSFCPRKGQWRRAVVRPPSAAARLGLQPSGVDSGLTLVEYVDFGGGAWVKCAKLLPPELRTCPPMAYQCSLAGIEPVQSKKGPKGDSWPKEVVEAFHALAYEKKFFVKVVDSSRGQRHLVDLRGITRDSTPSVVDALVYSKHARFAKGAPQQAAPKPTPDLGMLELPTLRLLADTLCDVQVSCATSPADFYVQLLENSAIIQRMTEKLTAKFSNLLPNKQAPHAFPGSFCCVQYSVDAQWYRGKILDLTGKHHATVQFVDYGNCEEVKLTKLYHIPPEYQKLPCQALHCCLPDLVPARGAVTWPSRAGEKLESCCQNGCVLQVTDAVLDTGCTPVSLVDTQSDHDVIISDELVRLGVASYGSTYDESVHYQSSPPSPHKPWQQQHQHQKPWQQQQQDQDPMKSELSTAFASMDASDDIVYSANEHGRRLAATVDSSVEATRMSHPASTPAPGLCQHEQSPKALSKRPAYDVYDLPPTRPPGTTPPRPMGDFQDRSTTADLHQSPSKRPSHFSSADRQQMRASTRSSGPPAPVAAATAAGVAV
eukprot:scpid20657/ scgid2106/ Tudor domain-containing protein 1; Cancer/testis antigen 41.1